MNGELQPCHLDWCYGRAWYKLQRKTYDDGKHAVFGDDLYVCELFLHRIEAAFSEYGCAPDKITEIPLNQERPELLDEIIETMKKIN